MVTHSGFADGITNASTHTNYLIDLLKSGPNTCQMIHSNQLASQVVQASRQLYMRDPAGQQPFWQEFNLSVVARGYVSPSEARSIEPVSGASSTFMNFFLNTPEQPKNRAFPREKASFYIVRTAPESTSMTAGRQSLRTHCGH